MALAPRGWPLRRCLSLADSVRRPVATREAPQERASVDLLPGNSFASCARGSTSTTIAGSTLPSAAKPLLSASLSSGSRRPLACCDPLDSHKTRLSSRAHVLLWPESLGSVPCRPIAVSGNAGISSWPCVCDSAAARASEDRPTRPVVWREHENAVEREHHVVVCCSPRN